MGDLGGAQRAHRAALQFGQNVVETLRGLVARHEPAAEHFMPALMKVVHWVVNSQHDCKLALG